MSEWRVRARNTATTSNNKIHDDDVARSLGFRGGLVPGVDVYAYMTHLPVAKWGREFLEHGSMGAKFVSPVYDGDEVTVTFDGVDITLNDASGRLCAKGWASMHEEPHPFGDMLASRPLPANPPHASARAFVAAPEFGSLEYGFHAEHAPAYLGDVGETLPLYVEEGIAHPGWLLRTANFVLAENVRLGPWIHVESRVEHHGVARDGDRLSTRATATDVWEDKGHRFVTLDVAIVANDDQPVMRVAHTAIYEPRREPSA